MAFLVNYSGLLIYDDSLSTYTIRNIGFKFIRDRAKSKKDSDRKFRKRENDRSHVIFWGPLCLANLLASALLHWRKKKLHFNCHLELYFMHAYRIKHKSEMWTNIIKIFIISNLLIF